MKINIKDNKTGEDILRSIYRIFLNDSKQKIQSDGKTCYCLRTISLLVSQ